MQQRNESVLMRLYVCNSPCRQQLDPTYVSVNEPPSVLGNAACWSLHMGLSSNLRYQLLGGADTVGGRVFNNITPPYPP
jgi:hypothetical protein